MPGRKKNPIPVEGFRISLPVPLLAQLKLHLFSDLEGKVPYGDTSKFFAGLLAEFFSRRSLDLAPFTGAMPGTHIVSGSAESIEALTRALKGEIPV